MPTTQQRIRSAGLGAGVVAGLVWGLAFLVPELLRGWSAVTITAGRYLAYGLVSSILFALGGAALRTHARRHWRPAVHFAITGNAGYYLLMVLGVQAVGAPVTGIIIGCIPVVIAVVGNLVVRSHPWRRLAPPISLVTVGLLVVNVLEMTGSAPNAGAPAMVKVAGIGCAFGAVALWTWYAIANARFLDRHPDVPDTGWSTIVGLATGAVTLAALPVAALTGQLSSTGQDPGPLVIGSLVLGIVVSWGGTALWNTASGRLPPTTAGILINVETVSGFAYVYAARGQWPPIGQLAGFAAILLGVVLVVRLRTGDRTRRRPDGGTDPGTASP
ncbi:DMT family transporter [Nonomuraea angiospora]|uniref:Drug/metabolite transporter (DMT)-like permease n=1 Tax=Nonomuraea angiospora TaxID=46172 RepID=A0ABR9LRM0_9ACTN|nr:DMT family transporter [Nonomuraea angiospora]MBE1582912.1 drug/metabolite transporter (DMT)-like permease [Nonomuraea angiospora]